MIGWLFLIGAIVFEVGGTLSLRMAATGHRAWYAGVVAGYVVSFTLLAQALANDVPLGVAYGIWAASGVAIMAVMARVLFTEPLTLVMGIGILLIVGGVLLVEVGTSL